MKKKDSIDVFFGNEAKRVLYSLVHRANPSGKATGNDDVFEPTISIVFMLLDDLLNKNIPDLYVEEWSLIFKALEKPVHGVHRLSLEIKDVRSHLVLSLEDLYGEESPINNFELSKKLAGFTDLQIYSIQWIVQKHHVARSRGESIELPEITFKG